MIVWFKLFTSFKPFKIFDGAEMRAGLKPIEPCRLA